MDKKKHILFLCSWYPNKTDPTNGNFVQKHAEAAALYNKVSSLSIFSDHIEENIKIDSRLENGVYNVTVYYKKVNSKIPITSSLLKLYRYILAFYLGYKTILKNQSAPNIVHLNIIYPVGVFALFLSKIKKYHTWLPKTGLPFYQMEFLFHGTQNLSPN